jgi:hypothetical protein
MVGGHQLVHIHRLQKCLPNIPPLRINLGKRFCLWVIASKKSREKGIKAQVVPSEQ